MPVTTQWDDEAQTMVRHDFSDPWTWDDYAAALRTAHEMIASAPVRVAVLFNFSETLHFPPDPLGNLHRILGPTPQLNWVVTVVVGAGPQINALLRLVINRLPVSWAERTLIIDSLPAARALVMRLTAAQDDTNDNAD